MAELSLIDDVNEVIIVVRLKVTRQWRTGVTVVQQALVVRHVTADVTGVVSAEPGGEPVVGWRWWGISRTTTQHALLVNVR